MARYLIAQRLAGREAATDRVTFGAFRANMAAFAGFVSQFQEPEDDAAVETVAVEGNSEEMRAHQQRLAPHMIVEEEKPRRLAIAHRLTSMVPWAADVPAGLGPA